MIFTVANITCQRKSRKIMAYERCQYVEEVMSKIVGSSKNHKGITTQEESDKMQFMAAQLLDDNLPERHIGFLKRIIT